MNTIQKVQLLGQSIWYDNINRELINNGYIKNLLDIGVTGLTSNPTLFEKAISSSKLYDYELLNLSKSGMSTEQIFESLAVDDIRNVAELLLPIYKETNKKEQYQNIISNFLEKMTEEDRLIFNMNFFKSINISQIARSIDREGYYVKTNIENLLADLKSLMIENNLSLEDLTEKYNY